MNKPLSLKGKILSLKNKLISFDTRRAFVFKIDTTKGNGSNSFILPLTNHVTDMEITVSDGQLINITDFNSISKTIQFNSPGIYTIKIYGECGWSFNGSGDYLKIIGIKYWGNFKFNYLKYGFYGCANIGLYEGIPKFGSIYAPLVTELDNLFSLCKLSVVYSDIFKRCNNVISFYSAFSYNNIITLQENLFLYNNIVENYSSTFEDAFDIGCEIPETLFNITDGITLYNVTNWNNTFYQSDILKSPSGTIQFIWYYTNTLNTTDCFRNCVGLSNYDLIPNEWKGL